MVTAKNKQFWDFGYILTFHHVASIDHVMVNSWCKFSECSTNRYYNIDFTISSLPWSLKREK